MTSVFLRMFTWIFMGIIAHRIFTAIIGIILGFIIYEAIVNPQMLGNIIAEVLKWLKSLKLNFNSLSTISESVTSSVN